MKIFATILPLILFVTGCTGVTNAPITDTTALVDYVGMTIEQAKAKAQAAATSFRVVMENGVALPATMDYRPGRINAAVQNGIVVRYDIEGEEQTAVYDKNSWKTMIPDSCASFFDGCNTCSRIEGGAEAACTRMFCETYEKPACRDGQ